MTPQTDSRFDPLDQGIEVFLRRHGVTGDYQLMPMPGGANNRVYRVSQPAGDLILKCYFQNAHDPRDRFGAERAFYEWVWSQTIRWTPEPLAWCAEKRLGLFTLAPGRKLSPDEVDSARVGEALDFLSEINTARDLPAAQALPLASEACFSLSEHLDCVDRRISRLELISSSEALDQPALGFVKQELSPAWHQIRAAIREEAAASGLPLDQAITPGHRCLSPSDFGFHNAILGADQRLRFFDFEYAGWDDSAKLVCDFFCQPQLSVNRRHWESFLGQLMHRVKADAALPARARLLWPAYQIKWCCIMLNEFVRSERDRRIFSAGAEMSAERLAGQLDKARQALRKAVETLSGEA